MPQFRWPKDFKARVLAWIDEDPTRGAADAERHFVGESLEMADKPLPYQTIKGWLRKRSRGTKPSHTAEAQREARKRHRMELIKGGKTSQGTSVGPSGGGDLVEGPRPAAHPVVDGLDPEMFSDDPIVRQRAYIRSLGQDLVKARIAHQGNVVAKLHQQMHEAQLELDKMIREAADRTGDLESMSEEEYIDHVREVAAAAPDPYLEVYVGEYLRRHKLRLVR